MFVASPKDSLYFQNSLNTFTLPSSKIETHQATITETQNAFHYTAMKADPFRSPSDVQTLDYYNNRLPHPSLTFDLDEFITTQGIDLEMSENEKLTEKMQKLKDFYQKELLCLNHTTEDFTRRLLTILNDQGNINQYEIANKIQNMNKRMEQLRQQLFQKVCNTSLQLYQQYRSTSFDDRKKRRSLPKKATDALNTWFYSHLENPYPTDDEKNHLAIQCGLTLNQVNNWFGNKRIRYKRKMQGAIQQQQTRLLTHEFRTSTLQHMLE